MNKNVVALSFLIVLLIAPSAISQNDDENLWVVSFEIYSGRPDPSIELNQDEIGKVQNMIAVGIRDAVNLASDDRHPDWPFYFIDGSSYAGIRISLVSGRDKRVEFGRDKHVRELYLTVGRYLRIYSDDGKSSKLHKMKNAKLEKYLANLGIRRGALRLGEQSVILYGIKQRKE